MAHLTSAPVSGVEGGCRETTAPCLSSSSVLGNFCGRVVYRVLGLASQQVNVYSRWLSLLLALEVNLPCK